MVEKKISPPVMAFTQNPFKYSAEDLPEDEQANQEEFLDLIHDSSAKAFFDDDDDDTEYVS